MVFTKLIKSASIFFSNQWDIVLVTFGWGIAGAAAGSSDVTRVFFGLFESEDALGTKTSKMVGLLEVPDPPQALQPIQA